MGQIVVLTLAISSLLAPASLHCTPFAKPDHSCCATHAQSIDYSAFAQLFGEPSAIETSSASPLMARARSAAFAAGSVSAVER